MMFCRCIHDSGVEATVGPDFSLYSLTLAAAVDSAGVLRGLEALVAPAIMRGDLVAPFDLKVPTNKAFSITLPAQSARLECCALVEWFRKEALG